MNEPNYPALVERFRTPATKAIALIGSYARGEAGPHSDVDFVRFTKGEKTERTQFHIVDGRMIVISEVNPSDVEDRFTNPNEATETIRGVQALVPLWDPDGYLEEVKKRANDFVWDDEMQMKADRWASRELAGWGEEACKGLGGLAANHEGKMVCARHGLTWGLTSIVRVQRGILIAGDNDVLESVVNAVGETSDWAALARDAFGLTGLDLSGQVRSGLKLYALTADMISDAILPEHREVIHHTMHLIDRDLPQH